jgi:hypothetical protein
LNIALIFASSAFDIYTASDHLPRSLFDKETGPSYDVAHTAFQSAVGTKKPRWDWLEEKVKVKDLRDGRCGTDGGPSGYPGPFGSELVKVVDGKSDDDLKERPEHAIFGMAMLGGGRVFGKAHLHGQYSSASRGVSKLTRTVDFPWESLGSALVVDIGGGVGGFSLQLSQLHPQLKFVIQDRAPVLKQAETVVWPKEYPEALAQKKIQFTPHNFFDVNPVKNADVYWLRYIIVRNTCVQIARRTHTDLMQHDWSDDFCVNILSAIKPSMGPRSRILIW